MHIIFQIKFISKFILNVIYNFNEEEIIIKISVIDNNYITSINFEFGSVENELYILQIPSFG